MNKELRKLVEEDSIPNKDLEELIKKDDEIVKSFTIDISVTDSIKIKNCDKCLFNCCDNGNNTEFHIPLTEDERHTLNKKHLVLIPKYLGDKIHKIRLKRLKGDAYESSCEFSSAKGCTLKKGAPLYCKIFPYTLYLNQIVISPECRFHKNSSAKDIKIGAQIAAKLLNKEKISYLKRTNLLNVEERKQFLFEGKDFLFTNIKVKK
jgi:hypothetical protein